MEDEKFNLLFSEIKSLREDHKDLRLEIKSDMATVNQSMLAMNEKVGAVKTRLYVLVAAIGAAGGKVGSMLKFWDN